MQYQIQNITHEPHDLDDDVIYFYFDVQFTEPEALFIKRNFFPYRKLLNYIRDKHPAFYRYVQETRRSIDGYGPCEARTMDAMGEAGVHQLYIYLEEYLQGCDWMEKEFLRHKEWQSSPPAEQIKTTEDAGTAFKELNKSASGLKEYQSRYRTFCETVTRQVRATALDIYPEIANLEPDELKEFQYLFANEIIRMHERVENLLYNSIQAAFFN